MIHNCRNHETHYKLKDIDNKYKIDKRNNVQTKWDRRSNFLMPIAQAVHIIRVWANGEATALDT